MKQLAFPLLAAALLLSALAAIPVQAEHIEWSIPFAPKRPFTGGTDEHHLYVLDEVLMLHKVNRSNGALLWASNPFDQTIFPYGFFARRHYDLFMTPTSVVVSNDTNIYSVDADNVAVR